MSGQKKEGKMRIRAFPVSYSSLEDLSVMNIIVFYLMPTLLYMVLVV